MESNNDPFDTLPDGTIKIQPVVGWATAPAMGTAVIVQLRYATDPEHLARTLSGQVEPASVQLIFTPDQADEFAARLQVLSDHIRAQSVPKKEDQN